MLLHVVNFSISLSLSSSALKNVFIALIFLFCSVFLRFAPLPLLHIFVLTCFPIFLHFFDLVPSCPLLSVNHICIFLLSSVLYRFFSIPSQYSFCVSLLYPLCGAYVLLIIILSFIVTSMCLSLYSITCVISSANSSFVIIATPASASFAALFIIL